MCLPAPRSSHPWQMWTTRLTGADAVLAESSNEKRAQSVSDIPRAGRPHAGAAQLLRHGLHVRPTEPQFRSDLPVREVQSHEVDAQDPHPQRLVMSGQHRAREVVKAPGAGLAPIPLPVRLRVIAAVANHRCTVAPRAADARWPAVLPYHGEALGIVNQGRKVDRICCGHDAKGSSGRPTVNTSSSGETPKRQAEASLCACRLTTMRSAAAPARR